MPTAVSQPVVASAAAVAPPETNKSAFDRLRAAIQKKRQIDARLASLETAIYAFEGSYLADTALTGGNIIKGFDAYMKNTQTNRRKQETLEVDRLFSLSSSTYTDSLKLQAQFDERQRQQLAQHNQPSSQSDPKKRKREESILSHEGSASTPGGRGRKSQKTEDD